MEIIWQLILILAVIIFFIIVLKYLKVGNLKVKDWLQVEFLKESQKEYYLSTMDKVGIVVSKNSEIYKLQLKTTYRGNTVNSLNNARLYISGIGWFVLRLFFSDDEGIRKPSKQNRVLEPSAIHEINIEFEPKDGWDPLNIKEKEYKSLLIVKTVDTQIKHKFIFQVRKQNVEAIKENVESTPDVYEVPIIKN